MYVKHRLQEYSLLYTFYIILRLRKHLEEMVSGYDLLNRFENLCQNGWEMCKKET